MGFSNNTLSILLKNYFVNELDLTSYKFSAIKLFFNNLGDQQVVIRKFYVGNR